VDVDGETEITREIAADFVPLLAGVVGAEDVPMFLHEENVRARGMERDAMDAVADFGVGIGKFVL
jgi:hypothetical protein